MIIFRFSRARSGVSNVFHTLVSGYKKLSKSANYKTLKKFQWNWKMYMLTYLFNYFAIKRVRPPSRRAIKCWWLLVCNISTLANASITKCLFLSVIFVAIVISICFNLPIYCLLADRMLMLQYSKHGECILQEIGAAFRGEHPADLQIVCDGSKNVLRAHRLVLAAASPLIR